LWENGAEITQAVPGQRRILDHGNNIFCHLEGSLAKKEAPRASASPDQSEATQTERDEAQRRDHLPGAQRSHCIAQGNNPGNSQKAGGLPRIGEKAKKLCRFRTRVADALMIAP
jgi:hypothetical protein